MRLPELARAALIVGLACASALLAGGAARAAGEGSLFRDMVCRDMADIPGEFDFANSFVGLAGCDRLCLDATFVCLRAVTEATTCQLAFANDWIAFDSRLDCDGLSGTRLRDCKAGWALDRQTWRAFIKNQRLFAASSCLNAGSSCRGSCSGH